MFTEIKDKIKGIYMGQETIQSPTRFEKNQKVPPAIKKKKSKLILKNHPLYFRDQTIFH